MVAKRVLTLLAMKKPDTDARGLAHPLFWIALAILVINDHALKGAGVLPGALTGKLSDFAGLLVAPVLLAALLGARDSRRRALAFVLIGGGFAAVKLVPVAAQATVALGAMIGLSWSFRADPTDLVALAILPLAWHVAAHRGPLAPRVWAERTALGLGVAACLASPPPEPQWNASAFVVNRTGRAIELRVRWVDVSMDCAVVRERPAEILPREAFASGTLFRVDVDETLPLDRGTALGGGAPVRDPFLDAGVATDGAPSHLGDCDAAILSAEGLPERLVFWDGLSPRVIPEVVEDDDDETAVEGGLDLVSDEDAELESILVGGRGYEIHELLEVYDGGAACRDYGAITGFAWTDLPAWSGVTVRLLDVRPTLDGCVSVRIEHADSSGPVEVDAFICVPPEDFPFLSNSEVQIWASPQELRIVRDLSLDDGTTWRTGELRVVRGGGHLREGPFDLGLVTVDAACGGVRLDCGGFRVPAAGGLLVTGGTRFVHPGDVVERDAADGRRARLRVGRAESMTTTHPACGAGRNLLGANLEALVVYGEEPR